MPTGSIRLHVLSDLAAGLVVQTTPAQAHYLARVMRLAPGGALRLFNGRDGEWLARLQSLARDGAGLLVESLLRPQAPEADIWLAFAPIRRDATELVVQKATELGVSAILPVATARTQPVRLAEARLAAIATEAAEQSERLSVPALAACQRLDRLLAEWPPGRVLFVALERAGVAHLPAWPGSAGLLVGPEGGFAPAELDLFAKHGFVRPASLGPRILRAETAAIAGLALLQAPVDD